MSATAIIRDPLGPAFEQTGPVDVSIGGDSVVPTAALVTLTQANYTPFMDINSGAAPINLNLPPEADMAGAIFALRNINGAANTIQVRNYAGGNIGSTIAAGSTGFYTCDGLAWAKVGEIAHA